MKKKTTEQFIEDAKLIHGDKYDYSKVVYISAMTKITIICHEHGEFQKTPNDHLNSKQGCKICSRIAYANSKKMTTEVFIKKAKEIHGEHTYYYNKVLYVGCYDKVIITCKTHGDFQQSPCKHLYGYGCNLCGIERARNKTMLSQETFVERANTIHNNKYDYSKVLYNGIYETIIIICKEHGEFQQKPNDHLCGNGCSKCSKYNNRYTTNDFIEKVKEIHGDKYDYSLVDYTKSITKIQIICKEHGEFEQTPNSHLSGIGCFKCGRNVSSKKQIWNNNTYLKKIKEIHCDKYDYSLVNYTGINNLITIKCRKHGEFHQKARTHLLGSGCPICIHKTEAKLYENLLQLYPTIINQFRTLWCKNKKQLPYDFVIPEYKIIIELDGPQHFQQISNWSSPEEQFENDKYKEKCANDNGYSVIRLLQEDVFYDTYDWVKELCETIEEIKNGDEIANVYLCKNGEYDAF
jgi:very-short-patch-repair endonuclease